MQVPGHNNVWATADSTIHTRDNSKVYNVACNKNPSNIRGGSHSEVFEHDLCLAQCTSLKKKLSKKAIFSS